MAGFRLLENQFAGDRPAAPNRPAAPGGLFHRGAFFRLHAGGPSAGPLPSRPATVPEGRPQHPPVGVSSTPAARYFEWLEGERVVASIHFTDAGEGRWRSPARGTFAGYAHVADLKLEDWAAFHAAVHARLQELGARHTEILPAPMAHDPAGFANQLYLLRSRGYTMTHCDLNQSLEVSAVPLADRMSYGNVKRLRKCEREGLAAGLLPGSELPAVYETLAANRASKGHAMSMTLAQLETMAATVPDAMVLFGCRDGQRLAAAALCLRLSPEVLYVFYWGDQPGYASLSPVVMLAQAIYRHGQEQGVRVLDVGTSTLDLEPNFGLLQFKRGLGFTESLKVRMACTLEQAAS